MEVGIIDYIDDNYIIVVLENKIDEKIISRSKLTKKQNAKIKEGKS